METNKTLDAEYWESRYAGGDIPWDIGHVSPPLKAYFDQLHDKGIRILIPGAGSAYEAIYLLENGFDNVHVCDISPTAIHNLQSRFPRVNTICEDFFCISGSYDLIVEQTFFCALDPSLRRKYFEKMHELLTQDGKLMGLLFASNFEKPGPPFGGSAEEYLDLMDGLFEPIYLKMAYNSIEPRKDNELFFLLKKQ